jgi:hypothetical protein
MYYRFLLSLLSSRIKLYTTPVNIRIHHILGLIAGAIMIGGITVAAMMLRRPVTSDLAALLPAATVQIFGDIQAVRPVMASIQHADIPLIPEVFGNEEIALVRISPTSHVWVTLSSGSLLASGTATPDVDVRNMLDATAKDEKFAQTDTWLQLSALPLQTPWVFMPWSWLPQHAETAAVLGITPPTGVIIEVSETTSRLHLLGSQLPWKSPAPIVPNLALIPLPAFDLQTSNMESALAYSHTLLGKELFARYATSYTLATLGADASYQYDIEPLLHHAHRLAWYWPDNNLKPRILLTGTVTTKTPKQLQTLHARMQAGMASARIEKQTFEDKYEASYVVSDTTTRQSETWTSGHTTCTKTTAELQALFLGTAATSEHFWLTNDPEWFKLLCPSATPEATGSGVHIAAPNPLSPTSTLASIELSTEQWSRLLQAIPAIHTGLLAPTSASRIRWSIENQSPGLVLQVQSLPQP